MEERAAALHALFDLARTGATPDDADALARRALLRYGAAHPRAPALARDWARDRLGRDARGGSVLGAPLPFRGTARARARLLAVVAGVAAEVGAADELDRAWTLAWELLDRPSLRESGAGWTAVLLELGRAAAAAERWELAELAGQRALERAMARGGDEARAEADRLLAEAWTRSGRMQWIGSPHGPRRRD